MKTKVFACLLAIIVLSSSTVSAQEAKASDVSSLDAIMAATYDSISGGAGEKRDWNRFLSLFHKDARLIPTGKREGVVSARAMSPADYIKGSESALMQGFYEREVARRVETFGNITHVLSTYEARRTKDDKDPFLRGINSFQLLNDGKRWWVVTIYWQAETADNKLPKEYLKSKN